MLNRKVLSFILGCLPFLSSTGKSNAMDEAWGVPTSAYKPVTSPAGAFTVTPPKEMPGDLIKAAIQKTPDELEKILDNNYCLGKYGCHPFEWQKKWLRRLNYVANNKMKTLGYPALFATGAGLTLYNREIIAEKIANLIYCIRNNGTIGDEDTEEGW